MTSTTEASPSPPPVAGSCLCGAVRFEIELPTRFCIHCHCTICRRNHGAAFVTWIGVPKAQFRLVSGEAVLTRFASSEQGIREFCSRCGSSLFCELAADPDTIDITLASLAGPVDRGPELHVFFDTHVEWLEITDSLPKITSSGG
ncbi:MAG: GFA family protein [Candidatus Binatia bacterium]